MSLFYILYFSSNSCSTCFGQPCAHHQELTNAWCYSVATNPSMDALPGNRTWQPSRSHGTYQHEAITSRSRQLLMMGTWLPETCWATIRREIKNIKKWHLVGFTHPHWTAHVFLQWVQISVVSERSEYLHWFAGMMIDFTGASLLILKPDFILVLTKYVLISSSRSKYVVRFSALLTLLTPRRVLHSVRKVRSYGNNPWRWERHRKKLGKRCRTYIIPNQFEKLRLCHSQY